MVSDSIHDQHKTTALMFDKKMFDTRVKAASHISITNTRMLIWCNNFILILEIKKITLKYFNFRQTEENFVFSVP